MTSGALAGLCVSHVDPLEEVSQLGNARLELGSILGFGGTLYRSADDGDGVESVASSRALHAVPENPNRFELARAEGRRHRCDVPAPVLEESRDEWCDLGVDCYGNSSSSTAIVFIGHVRPSSDSNRRYARG